MTARKQNKVETLCGLASLPQTYAAQMAAARNHFGTLLDTMTAAQIAAVLEFGYSQHTHGAMTAE